MSHRRSIVDTGCLPASNLPLTLYSRPYAYPLRFEVDPLAPLPRHKWVQFVRPMQERMPAAIQMPRPFTCRAKDLARLAPRDGVQTKPVRLHSALDSPPVAAYKVQSKSRLKRREIFIR
jgi:hypothetical protein